MKVLISAESEVLAEYLLGVGHSVKQVYANDNLIAVLPMDNYDVIVYDLQQPEIQSHDKILRELNKRTVLIGSREDKIIPFAAGLGIKDFIFTPCRPEDVLHRVETPTTQQEAADLLRSVPGLQPERIIEIVQIEQKTEQKPEIKEKAIKEINHSEHASTIDIADNEVLYVDKPITIKEKPNFKISVLKFITDVLNVPIILINISRIGISSVIIVIILTLVIYLAGFFCNLINLTDGIVPVVLLWVKTWIDSTILTRW